jgi:hypothetical protein
MHNMKLHPFLVVTDTNLLFTELMNIRGGADCSTNTAQHIC